MQPRMNFFSNSPVDQLGSIDATETALLPRHRWYFFKEAFSPSLVECAIEDAQCKKDDLIIDPFSGSGTVALTAALQGYQGVGCEVNPFLAFIAQTKLLQCGSRAMDNNAKRVITGAEQGSPSPLEGFSSFSDNGKNKKWLFNPEVLEAFEGGWQITNAQPKPVRDVMRLCLIGAAMDVCNAVKDGKCLRYRDDWTGQHFGRWDFLHAFQKRIDDIKQDILSTPIEHPNIAIHLTDSRHMSLELLQNKRFKLCVMSPPYLNSFDYTDIYRPELFLGKFVRSKKALKALRFNTVRSHVQVKWKQPQDMDFGQLFTESFTSICSRSDELWDAQIPAMIQAYFEDMKQVLTNLRSMAKPDATLWIVVSTSAYAGVEIPVDYIIADIGSKTGWFPREVKTMRYLKRVAGQQWDELNRQKNNKPYLRESIVILDMNRRTRKA